MKLVTAIVRPEKLPDVLEALFRAEVTGLSISRVQGHGGETEQVHEVAVPAQDGVADPGEDFPDTFENFHD